MSKTSNKADDLIFKALQKAVAEDRLHICLISAKINIPGSPVYNPWEVLLPSLLPVLLGLFLIWAAGILWGLAFMIAGIMLSSNLVKKELEQRLFERTRALLTSDYENCCRLWAFGGIVLVNAADKSQGCVAPDGNWKEFVVLHFADLMIDKKTEEPEQEAVEEKAA